MAGALGVNLGQWHRTLDQIQSLGFECGARTLSAGQTSKPGGRGFEPTLVADYTSDPFDRCYRREQRELLGRALSRPPERERRVITLYYCQGLTMRQIAGLIKVDASRVSQMHSAAMAAVDSLLCPRCAQTRQPKDTPSTPASATT